MYFRCQKCGKLLSDPESKTRGYGPECWSSIHGKTIFPASAKWSEVPGQIDIFDYQEKSQIECGEKE